MKKPILLSVFFCVAVLSVAAQSTAKEELAIKWTIDQLVGAQTSYDVKTQDKLLTGDYFEVSPLGEIDTRDKVLSFYSPDAKAAAAGSAQVTTSEHSIRIYDKFAIAIVRLDYVMSANGKTLPPRSIRVTFALSRTEKSSWRIASAQYTGIRPSQPPKQS